MESIDAKRASEPIADADRLNKKGNGSPCRMTSAFSVGLCPAEFFLTEGKYADQPEDYGLENIPVARAGMTDIFNC